MYVMYVCNFAHFNHSFYLVEPHTFSHFGDRSFQKIALKLWNELSCHMKKQHLLKHLIIIIIIKYGCLLRTVPKEILDSLCTTVLRYLKKLSEQLNLKRIS